MYEKKVVQKLSFFPFFFLLLRIYIHTHIYIPRRRRLNGFFFIGYPTYIIVHVYTYFFSFFFLFVAIVFPERFRETFFSDVINKTPLYTRNNILNRIGLFRILRTRARARAYLYYYVHDVRFVLIRQGVRIIIVTFFIIRKLILCRNADIL